MTEDKCPLKIVLIILAFVVVFLLGFFMASTGVQHMYLDRMETIAIYCKNGGFQ